MKKGFKIAGGLTGVLLVALASGFYFNKDMGKSPVKFSIPIFEKLINTPTKSLIESALKGVEGVYISNATKADADNAYKGVTADAVPHVFIEQIPPDFFVETVEDETLFMKIMTAHLLRTNEKILKERKVLLYMEEKIRAQESLTDQEKDFFNKMVKKYDVEDLNDIRSQMAELISRVDIIPVSLGVAVSIWATNWGQKNQKSPFLEHAWNKDKKYAPIEFDDISSATDSFALQLNTRSQLMSFRSDRQYLRMFINKDTFGKYSILNLRNYLHFIPTFSDEIELVYNLGYIKELDNACFKEGCWLTK